MLSMWGLLFLKDGSVRNWNEIHGAKIVDIRKVRGEKRIARYLISNYLVNQTFVRMSWSWGWVFRGFVGW